MSVTDELPSQRAASFFERAKDLHLAGACTSIEQERMLRDLYKAVSFMPDQISHYMFLGKIYRLALDITSSIFCYRFVLNLQPTNLQARKQLSELLVVRGQELMVVAASVKSMLKFHAARACFDEALDVNKDDTDAWICKSVCHIHAQELTEAFEAVNRAIKCPRKPTAEMFILRAKIFWGRGLTEQGNVDIRVAAMMDANHPEVVAFFNRSFLKAEILYKEAVKHFTACKYKEALLAVNHAIHITTEDVKLLILQSKVYRMMGELQSAYDSMLRAKAIFEKAFQDTQYPMELPSDIVLQINLILNDMSLECASKGDYSKAILLLNKIIKTELSLSRGGLVKVNYRYYINRGDCHRALNSLADAVYDYNLALDIMPEDWEIKTRLSLTHYLIATVYFNQSQFYETQLELDKAIKYNPKVSEYFFVRGRTHYFQSNFQQAYADFKKALELDGSNNEVREWLSQFDDEQRSPSKAGEHPAGGGGARGGRGKKAAQKLDFTKVSHWRDPSTVRKLQVTDQDMVEMMLLPKQARKLPTLRMLTHTAESDQAARKQRAAKSIRRDPAHAAHDALPEIPAQRSPFVLDEAHLQVTLRASAEVQKKTVKLQNLFATAAEGVNRGPLWELVETAKALAYAKSHPKHRQNSAPLPTKPSSGKGKEASKAKRPPSENGGKAKKHIT
jgi:tetratricopeptide (TPR) repeat protein